MSYPYLTDLPLDPCFVVAPDRTPMNACFIVLCYLPQTCRYR